MTRPAQERARIPAPLRISVLYALFGTAWILLGDVLQLRAGELTAGAFAVGIAKGLVFVVVSAALLWFLIHRETVRREHAAAELRAVLDTAPVGIVALDSGDRVTRWNDAARQILGWSEDEVIGRPIRELGLVPSEGADTPLAPDTEVRSRSGEAVAIRIFRNSDETQPDGGSVLVFRDRRPQIAMEAALRRAHKLEAVGRLAGGIAHEFNNILTAILGHTVLLLERIAPDDDRRESAVELRRAADRAAGLTRQLLVFSGKHVTRPIDLDLTRLMRDMRAVAERIAGEDVRIALQLEDPLWTVRCDAAQIQQMVLNLVVNAREAMSDAGTLTVRTANVPADAPRGTTEPLPPGEFVLLAISDSGRGMSAETLAHLFEPFFTTKEQGTGLGLAAVYGIVQQCDGMIRVRSEPGRGSTFEIYLPRSVNAAAVPAPATPQAAQGASLMVVEDDDAVRDLTCRVLRRAGHEVVSARNGLEALTLLRNGTAVRLVIADIVMPGMNGFELGQHIRRDHPRVTVLYTSGYVAADAADSTALDPDMFFLEKPFRPDELLSRVSSILAAAPTSS